MLHDIYQDNSVSASRREKRRPEYDRMVRDFEAGRFSIIVCYNLDRLTRQPSQLEEWIERSERRGLRIVTLTGEADLSTDDGRMFARIKVSVAKSEVERMGARRRRANLQTIAEGRPAPGRRPYGWEVDGITLREEEAAVVRSIYAAVLAGDSLRALVRDLNARGVPSPQNTPWTAFKLRQVIDRERNYGALIRYGVEQPTSLVQPIVTRDEHEQAQAIIAGRAQPGRKPEKNLLSGLAICAVCDRPMGAKALKSRNAGEREPYYVCTSRINRTHESDGKVHPTIRARILEERAREEVVKAFLYGPGELFPGQDDGGVAEAAVRLQDVRTRMDRLEAAVEDGSLQRGRVAVRMAPLLREEKAALAALTTAQGRAATGRFVDIRAGLFRPGQRVAFADAAKVRDQLGIAYDAIGFDQKRDLVRALLDIRVSPGYGARRAALRHLVVTSLNDDDETDVT